MENKILIVEKDVQILNLFKDFLAKNKEYERVDFANSCEDAMRLLQKENYSKIVVDCSFDENSNEMSIFEAARTLGVENRIVITSNSKIDIENIQEVTSWMKKPVTRKGFQDICFFEEVRESVIV